MGPRRVVLAVLGACWVVLSGCVVIKSQDAAQQDVIGRVRLTTVLCASQQGRTGTQCDSGGNAGRNASNDSTANPGTETQLLVAYRVPAGTTGPASFETTAPLPASAAPAKLTFARSPSYEGELGDVLPAPDGFTWIGYLSSPFRYAYDTSKDWSAQAVAQQVTVAPELSLPVAPDGAPFAGPFPYRVIAGWRRSETGSGVAANRSSARPVKCLTDPSTAGDSTDTECADAPAKASIASNLTVPVRDAGIVGGPPVVSSHGATATVPFSFRFTGASGAPLTFALSASTDVPGASATPSRDAIPVTGDTTSDVSVGVPIGPGVPPGDYTVTLRATLPNGQTRTQRRTLTVAGPPVNTSLPSIAGDPLAGHIVDAQPGEWSSLAPPTFGFRWQRCDARGCSDIEGGTRKALRVDDVDESKRLRVLVSATTVDGTTIVASIPSERIVDRNKPTMTLALKRTRYTRRRFLRGVAVSVNPSEPVRLTFELLASSRRARLAAVAPKRNVVLARREVPGSNLPMTVLVRPRKALVKGNRGFGVTVAVTARDASRNAVTVRKVIRVGR